MPDLIARLYSYAEALRRAVRDNSSDVPPLAASFKVTTRCNSRCRYCGVWTQRKDDIPRSDVERVVDELASLGVQVISLTGGEALMRDDLLSIVSRVNSNGMIACINSNGVLLASPRLEALVEAGLATVTLSLDTLDAETYRGLRGISLNAAMSGFEALVETKRRFPNLNASVNCVVSRANLEQILPLVEHCHRLGIAVGFQPMHQLAGLWGPTDAEEERLKLGEGDAPTLHALFDRLVEMKSQGYPIANDRAYLTGIADYLACRRLPSGFKCIAGFTSIGIDDELNVYSCVSMAPLGNLYATSLEDLWRSDAYRQRRADMVALRCPGCWLRCHSERSSDEWIDGFVRWIVYLNLPPDHPARAHSSPPRV